MDGGKTNQIYCPTDQMVADVSTLGSELRYEVRYKLNPLLLLLNMTKPAPKFKLIKFAKFMFGE